MSSVFGNLGSSGSGNYVTLDTDQEITGRKRFLADVAMDAFTDATDITFTDGEGITLNVSDTLTTLNADIGNLTITNSLLVDVTSDFTETANFAAINATNLSLSGNLTVAQEVSFNYLTTPPHCAAVPQEQNDLCNKQYVDSKAALTAYQLFFNQDTSFTTPASVTYKQLSSVQTTAPSTVAWTVSSTTAQFLFGYFNTLAALNLQTSIPQGIWTLLMNCNVSSTADQAHVGFFFTIVAYNAAGTEFLLYTSPLSALIGVIAPSRGMTSLNGTVPLIDLTGAVGIGVKVYLQSSTNATRTGNLFFEQLDSYSSILTSYAFQQSPNILASTNNWTGSNSFNTNTVFTTLNGALTGSLTGNVTGNVTGNADTATTAANATQVSASLSSTGFIYPLCVTGTTAGANKTLLLDSNFQFNSGTNVLACTGGLTTSGTILFNNGGILDNSSANSTVIRTIAGQTIVLQPGATTVLTADAALCTFSNAVQVNTTLYVVGAATVVGTFSPNGGILTPSPAITYTNSSQVGYFSGTISNTFIEGASVNSTGTAQNTANTFTMAPGVWIVNIIQILSRGTATFPNTSYTNFIPQINSGTATLPSTALAMTVLNGNTHSQVNTQGTYTVVVTESAVLRVAETSVFSGTCLNRGCRFTYTRIA